MAMRIFLVRATLAFALLAIWPCASWAHAFPVESEPGAGDTVQGTPFYVRIRFDVELEPIFCTLRVQNNRGQTVSEGKGHVDSSDATLLLAHVPSVPPGIYHVYWKAASRDGHRTQGDYTYNVR